VSLKTLKFVSYFLGPFYIESVNSEGQAHGRIIFQFRLFKNDMYGTVNGVHYFRIPEDLKEHIIKENSKIN